MHYPEQPLEPTTDNDYVKELKCLSDSNFEILENNSSLTSLLNRTNNYMKLIKICSFNFRFFRIIRNKERVSGPVSLEERKGAELKLIREVQKGEFYSDIESLKRDSQVPRRSKLKSLNPFIDNDGILRVGSRLAQSQVSYDCKYPIILPARHRLTYLIMYYYHLKYLHLGPEALLSTVRQKFWPIRRQESC
ncbi:uncharacterized protein LOC118186655 [Stegodyphus dumicola]|uniref:uncharacterized protein LOC118186655 n=1 Tax=Stegodyphus dumicola TaxID=202533 RepID=UPI0015A8626C|nr:uncharacterized protein LOC118186655 [Stegodyphus dumicola]